MYLLRYIHVLGIYLSMYKVFFLLALLSVPIVLLVLRNNYKYTKKQALFYSAITLSFGLCSAILTAVLKKYMLGYASGWTYSDDELLRNYGIPIFLPLFLLCYCLIRKENFKKLSDYIAPCVYSVMTLVKTGCTFWGCCYGAKATYGIWNEVLGYNTFPVQVYDAVSSAVIFVICLVMIKKLHENHFGYVYPIGGLLFAMEKGFWESYRIHPSQYEQSFLGTEWTLWQYWMLVLFVGCLIWLVLVVLEDYRNRKRRANVRC